MRSKAEKGNLDQRIADAAEQIAETDAMQGTDDDKSAKKANKAA